MAGRLATYIAAAFAGVAAAFFLSGIFCIASVSGDGMEPALESGDAVIINRLAYSSCYPQTGDIAAFRSYVHGENGESGILVRRVAGGPGDTVEIKDNVFYLNGKPYEEYMNEAVSMEDMDKITLDEYSLFVLNDNRKEALDSRDQAVGVLDVSDIIGKVCFR